MAIQLKRDVLPILEAAHIKLYLISIGTPERGLEFVDRTGFPADRFLADPTNAAYDALGFARGVKETFFDWATPQAIWRRIKSGSTQDIKYVLSIWKELWVPPKPEQAFQQGGVVLFKGKDMVWSHYDPATGSHVDLDTLLKAAMDA